MKKLKKYFSLTMIAALVVMVTGCGVFSGGSSGSSDKKTITWLVRSDPAANPWEKQLIKDFEKKHPNIKVQLLIVPQDQIDQKLQTMIASGSPPDVFSANWEYAGFATFKKDLLDLTPYVNKEPDVLKGFNPKLLDLYKVEGKLLGIPILSLGSFVFYNKDLFDKAGLPYPPTSWEDKSWTWDKMVEYAKKLTQNAGDPKKAIYGLHDGLWPGNADAMLWGGDYFTSEAYKTGKMGTPTVDDLGVRKGIQAHLDLIQKHKVSPSPSQQTAMSQIGDPFLTGRVAMIMTAGSGFWVYKPAKFRWGVAPLPYTVDGRKVVLFTDPINISKSSKHPDEAWELVKAIIDPKDGLKKFMETTGATPPHDELLEQWFQMEAKITGLSVEQLKELQYGAIKYGQESANHLLFGFNSIDTVMSQSLNAVYDGKKSIDQALKDIKAGLLSLKLK